MLAGESVTFDLKPPTSWRFNERMIRDLDGQIAVQQTRIQVEIKM